jgi:hypothetical protein
LAGILTVAGLVTQFVTFFWNQASAFLLFAMVGTPLVVAGTILFLLSVISRAAD